MAPASAVHSAYSSIRSLGLRLSETDPMTTGGRRHVARLGLLLRRGGDSLIGEGGTQDAAQVAYFLVMAFPAILLLLVWAFSNVLGDDSVRNSIVDWIVASLPLADPTDRHEVEALLDDVAAGAGGVGWVGAIALLVLGQRGDRRPSLRREPCARRSGHAPVGAGQGPRRRTHPGRRARVDRGARPDPVGLACQRDRRPAVPRSGRPVRGHQAGAARPAAGCAGRSLPRAARAATAPCGPRCWGVWSRWWGWYWSSWEPRPISQASGDRSAVYGTLGVLLAVVSRPTWMR